MYLDLFEILTKVYLKSPGSIAASFAAHPATTSVANTLAAALPSQPSA